MTKKNLEDIRLELDERIETLEVETYRLYIKCGIAIGHMRYHYFVNNKQRSMLILQRSKVGELIYDEFADLTFMLIQDFNLDYNFYK